MKVDIQVDDRQVMDLFRHMIRAGADQSRANREISEVLRESMELAFDRESDPVTGAKWKPLHPLTIKERQVAGNWPGKILQRSGHLVSSLTVLSGPDFAAAGTNVLYAAIQNSGGTVKPKAGKALRFGGGLFGSATIPARRFAGVWPEHLDQITDILGRFILDDS